MIAGAVGCHRLVNALVFIAREHVHPAPDLVVLAYLDTDGGQQWLVTTDEAVRRTMLLIIGTLPPISDDVATG